MENTQMPSMQPITPAGAGQVVSSGTAPNGMPMVQKVPDASVSKKDISGLIKTIVIIILTLVALTFIGLFIWMMLQYNESKTDVDGQIAVAVAAAKDEQATELEEEFEEREKNPYNTFSGPADYGHLSFEYPKTWSVYIEKDASSGGDFAAYLNPLEVNTVAKDTINALRVEILDKSFDEVAKEYQKAMDKKDSNLTMVSTTIGVDNAITANRYTGTIPNTQLSGYIVIFKIRDKTVVLRTDSVLFEDDYNKLLGTVTFNE